MKPFHTALALLAALLMVVSSFAAGESDEERHIKMKIAADGEVVSFDANDLEIGETRQIFTESGKEVLVTRTEEGFQLEIDGKEIDVNMPYGDDHHSVFAMTSDENKKVIIRKMHGEGDEHGYQFIHGGDGEHHWVGDGEDIDIVVERFSAADQLIESGVLDDLDESKRQEILDALKPSDTHKIHKRVRVEVKEEIDGDQ